MVRSLDLVVLFLSVFFAIAAAQNTTGTVVDLSYAKYRATYNSTLDINSFLGLPFAAPPTGQLRWKAPLPYAPPPGLNATIIDTKRGPACVQGYPFWTTGDVSSGIPVAGSEDCLVLDIFTPGTVRDGAKLPVLLSIPGGGYTMGDASLVPPFALMQHAQNAFIFVNIQYRLGAYGFAGSDEYINQGGAANVGLLDQRFAMEWVQKNIAVFGGDPEKVTIQGGSAGGGSVTSHMIWRGGVERAPFRAAMADFPWWQQQLREEQLAVQFGYLLSSANCSTLACLRDLPEESLKTASQATYGMGYRDGAYGYGSFYYGPYIDGELLLDLPSREFKAGHFAKLPMMVSREGLEGVTFSNQSMKTIEEETADMKKHFPFASKTFIARLYELYPRETFNSIFWQRQTWFGDFSIDCPTYYIATSLAASNTPVFKSVFNAGAKTHGSTGPYLATLDPASDPTVNLTLASAMKDWFVSFLLHKDPNAQSWSNSTNLLWPDYQMGEVMSLNDSNYAALSDAYYDDSDRCRFFWENGDVVQN